jgi:hypothetical protein
MAISCRYLFDKKLAGSARNILGPLMRMGLSASFEHE